MQRKIILSLAMSLDGFIATSEGGYGWIAGDGTHDLDTKDRWNYEAFLQTVDLVIMGKNCFDQKMHEDFTDQKVWVATSESLDDSGNVHFIRGDIADVVVREKSRSGKNIFIFGGGKVAHHFLQSDAIDEYYIGIVPIILGSGKPLFVGGSPEIPLRLKNIISEEGVVVLHYVRR